MANLNHDFEKFQAHLPQTGHDLGRKFYFTASSGMILPVWYQKVNPGEKLKFNFSARTQCQPIVRPADINISQKVDLFFVPIQKLFTPYGQIMYGTNDYISSGFNSESNDLLAGPDQFPLVSVSNLRMIGFDVQDAVGAQYQDHFGSTTLSTENFDSKFKGMFRLLMHLGRNPLALFGGLSDDQLFSDYLNYTYEPSHFPIFAAAYQCIYNDYYRNDDREKRELLSYQLDYMVNLDISNDSIFKLRYHQRYKDYYTSLRVSPIFSVLNLRGAVDGVSETDALRKVNNYLYDVNSSVDNDYYMNGINNIDSGNESEVTNTTNKAFGTISDQYEDHNSPASLRGIFAVEKLLRITGRAKKNYDSQVLAHLGVKVPRDIKHELSFIGSFSGNIGVQKIASTANTAYDAGNPYTTNLGELAGNAVGGLGGRPINFTAPCDGIVMAVYYAIPEFSYPLGTVIDKQTQISQRLDLWLPEFDRLGDQPFYMYETFLYPDDTLAPSPSLALGWQRRYEQYKRKYDVHSMAFMQGIAFKDDAHDYGSLWQERTLNTWSPWVVGRYPFTRYYSSVDSDNKITDITPRAESFLVSPSDLNNIFVQSYETKLNNACVASPWLIFQTDPFKVALTADVKMISRMSVTGEPELD